MYLAAVRLILRFRRRLLSAARSAERTAFYRLPCLKAGRLPYSQALVKFFFCAPAGRSFLRLLTVWCLKVRSLSCSQALVKFLICVPADRSFYRLPCLKAGRLPYSQTLMKLFSARLRAERAAVDRLMCLKAGSLSCSPGINEVFSARLRAAVFCGF